MHAPPAPQIGASPSTEDVKGYTALHHACSQGKVGAVELLLRHNAPLDAQAQSTDVCTYYTYYYTYHTCACITRAHGTYSTHQTHSTPTPPYFTCRCRRTRMATRRCTAPRRLLPTRVS